MKNNEGKIIVDSEEVKAIYKNFYEELLEKAKWEGEEYVIKRKVEDRMREILKKEAEQENLIITDKEVSQVIKNLEKKKAGDHKGWKNELIVAGGHEMMELLVSLFNIILETLTIARQWRK